MPKNTKNGSNLKHETLGGVYATTNEHHQKEQPLENPEVGMQAQNQPQYYLQEVPFQQHQQFTSPVGQQQQVTYGLAPQAQGQANKRIIISILSNQTKHKQLIRLWSSSILKLRTKKNTWRRMKW